MRGREARWISTGRGRGSRRGAEGEEAAGGSGGERVEVAPRGSGARRRSEQRGVAGGVENQRAARLVRHGRARLGRLLSSPLRRGAALCSAGPHVGLSPDFHNTRRGRGAHVSAMRQRFLMGLIMGLENGLGPFAQF